MGQLSKHFTREEFLCPCCKAGTVDPELITVLEDVREFFGQPVRINSGYRCEKHNKEVGGEPNSMHMKGIAADITVKEVIPSKVAAYLQNKYPDTYGIGLYKSWTHIDVRPKKARWSKL